jgi:6-phosphofructokinase
VVAGYVTSAATIITTFDVICMHIIYSHNKNQVLYLMGKRLIIIAAVASSASIAMLLLSA